jgi:folate-binding protein YgfZ
MLGPRMFSLCEALDAVPAIAARLREAGAIECGRDALETCRIEAGMPLFGRDITDDNLPQEVNRNAQAISFTKGCYLGQETVARIDALGHVNKLLVRLQFLGQGVPSTGSELTLDGKTVGHVTSATFSPRIGKALALAYVRTASTEPGTRLQSAGGDAVVVG